jgi:hypothetical protein
MSAHVATGILALVAALLHGAMAPGNTVGGHAFWGLAFLVVTGAIGRWFYAFVPHAANGRELAVDEVRARVSAMAAEWDRHPGFGERVHERVQALVEAGRWEGSFLQRLGALLGSQRELSATLAELAAEGQDAGLTARELRPLLRLARRAHRTALVAARYEELRALLASWRWFHRWCALLMVLLVVVHVVVALRYGGVLEGGAR